MNILICNEPILKKTELNELIKISKFLEKNSKIYLNFCVETFLKEGSLVLDKKAAAELNKKRTRYIKNKILELSKKTEKQVVTCPEKSDFAKSGVGTLSIDL